MSTRKAVAKAGRGGVRRDAVIPAVADLAALWRVQWRHQRPARLADGRWRTAVQGTGGVGFPDLELWGPGGFIVRECKGRGGKPTAQQRQRIEELREAGIDADFWTPDDLEPAGGRVAREIKALARPRKGIVVVPGCVCGCG